MADEGRNAVAYMRISERMGDKRDDFAPQRRRIRRYAKNRGFHVVAEFTDVCVPSAAGLRHRRGLAALLDYVEQHGLVDTALVEKDDSLGDEILAEAILAQLAPHVRVVAVNSDLELTSPDSNPSRKQIRRIITVATKFNKSVLLWRLKAGRERVRHQKGRCEGPKPFGSYDHERETLNKILMLYRKPRGEKRLGYYRIATILNKEGYHTRSKGPWTGPTVRGIIHRYKKGLRGQASF